MNEKYGLSSDPLETATGGLDELSYFGGCSLGERSHSLLYEPVSARLLEFSLAEQSTFGRLGATRFRSTNRRRNGFHRVAPAALEDAVLESSHAGGLHAANPCIRDTSGSEDVRSATVEVIHFRAWTLSQ